MTQDQPTASDLVAQLTAAFEKYLAAVGKSSAPEDTQAREEQGEKVRREAVRIVRCCSPAAWAARHGEPADAADVAASSSDAANVARALKLAMRLRQTLDRMECTPALQRALMQHGLMDLDERDGPNKWHHIAYRQHSLAVSVIGAARRLSGRMPTGGYTPRGTSKKVGPTNNLMKEAFQLFGISGTASAEESVVRAIRRLRAADEARQQSFAQLFPDA